MDDGEPLDCLMEAESDEVGAFIAQLSDNECREWQWDWNVWGRRTQLAPQGDWRVWLVMAGRGFGKTRLGAEWVRERAEADPEARIALVGASLHEARSVMVEGESGLLSIGAPWRRPTYESSVRRLVWPNGAQAFLYSAGEPDSLRGPQHSHAFRAISKGGHGQRGACRDRFPAFRVSGRHAAGPCAEPFSRSGLDRLNACNRSICGS